MASTIAFPKITVTSGDPNEMFGDGGGETAAFTEETDRLVEKQVCMFPQVVL
jgi:hypothetical protein